MSHFLLGLTSGSSIFLLCLYNTYTDGFHQNGTNWADGVPGISQCPIPAKSSFTYRFTVTGQYGTYWYHSHMGNTQADGIIVSSPAPLTNSIQTNATTTRAQSLFIVDRIPTCEAGTTIMNRSSCWAIGCESAQLYRPHTLLRL